MKYCVGILLIGVVHSLLSVAWALEPSSQVVWDSQTRGVLASGNVERGKALALRCASCHGEQGIAPSTNWPSLAGQVAAYNYKQLLDYKNGSRVHPIMQAMVEPLGTQDFADLAAYYASQTAPAPQVAAANPVGSQLALRGDGARLLPACRACHGYRGEGSIVDVPRLAGQEVRYFTETMRAYKSGQRANDLYSRMRLIAAALSDDEIQALANYYATLAR